MLSSLWSVALYVFALFPGIAFSFAREGHQPVARRSVLRETAVVVLVSTVCDSVVALVISAFALIEPFRVEVVRVLSGDLGWVENHLLIAVLATLAVLVTTTLCGYFLGSKWAYDRGLKTLWRAVIPRDRSAWSRRFDTDDAVQLGLQLKSGTWIGGSLFDWDNDPDQHPHRALTLTQVVTRDGDGGLVDLTDYLVVEAGEIEYLQIVFTESSATNDDETGLGSTARR